MATTYPTGTDDEREAAIEAAAEAVQRGGLVVLPTDTVYGVGADAFDHAAVQALLDAKGRGREMPPPVLISSATTLDALATKLPAYVAALTEAFWPGPLTLVCDQQPSLTWDLGEARGTVAVRMPDHAVALALLERTGPLAVSSANLSGLPAATEAASRRRHARGDASRSCSTPVPRRSGRGLHHPGRPGRDPGRAPRGCALGRRAQRRPGAARGRDPGRGRRGGGAEQPELDSMLVAELRAKARELGITGAGSMRKAQLIEAIRAEGRG